MPDSVVFTGNIAHRLATIAARVRERALAAGAFDAQVAADVEELAHLASLVAEATLAVTRMSQQLADVEKG